ncbi:MAG: GDSL-type esterase/lipase family protein [Bryobacteraceae bacterium]
MPIPRKTSLAVVTFAVMAGVPYFLPIPVIRDYRPLDPKGLLAVLDFPMRKSAEEEVANPLASPASVDALKAKRMMGVSGKKLVDPSHALDHFYDALLKNEVTRIIHYGDSPTTADLITADARTSLQKEFGSAGSGFVLIARPWAWYNHRGVSMEASNWHIDIAGNAELKDGLYGLGAVSFRGQPGAVAHWNLRDTAHTSVEVYYLSDPEGGAFVLEAEGKELGMVDTKAETRAPGFAHFDIPPGSSHFTLKVTDGNVRAYGADFRKDGPGVVYSSIGVNGANVTLLSRALDLKHWAEELRHYNPDLVIINYGTNESGFPNFVDGTWGRELRLAVTRLREALPGTSILLMSPMDRGELKATGEIDTIAALPRLVNTESRIALDTGVAFFNTFEAMGGQGTMARWYTSEPRLVGADYIHPMPAGAKIVGELLYSALHDGLQQYKLQTLKQRMAETASPKKEETSQP